MPTPKTFRDEVLHHFATMLDHHITDGTLDDFTTDAANAAARAAANAVIREARYRKRFGQFYRIDQACEVLGGVTRQAVNKRVQTHRILRVITRDNIHLYPAFQFTATGKIDPAISELVSILGNGGMDEWNTLYWLTTPIPAIGNRTAVEAIDDEDCTTLETLRHLAHTDSEARTFQPSIPTTGIPSMA